jgi:hypothetical protein
LGNRPKAAFQGRNREIAAKKATINAAGLTRRSGYQIGSQDNNEKKRTTTACATYSGMPVINLMFTKMWYPGKVSDKPPPIW